MDHLDHKLFPLRDHPEKQVSNFINDLLDMVPRQSLGLTSEAGKKSK
jgi:hypothetical protein